MWRKGNPPALLVGMGAGWALLKTVWRLLKELDRDALPPSHCTAGDLPQRHRCSERPRHLHPDVYSSKVHNSQTVDGATVHFEKLDVVTIYDCFIDLNYMVCMFQ